MRKNKQPANVTVKGIWITTCIHKYCNIIFLLFLIFKELPCSFVRGLVDKNPTEHESVSFDVTLSKPNHQVKWFVNDVEVAETIKFKPKKIDDLKFTLEINDVLLADEGAVKCVILNEIGDKLAESVCKLAVKGISKL